MSWALLSDRSPQAPAPVDDGAVTTAEARRNEARTLVDNLIAAIEKGADLDDRLALRQAELARAEEDLVTARREASAAPPTSAPEVARGILSAIALLDGMPEDERYAARAAAAQELRDLLTEIRCHADGNVTAWVGDMGFRIHMDGNEARIEGGVEITPGECLVMRWETRSGVVAEPSLPMRNHA